MRPRSPVSTGGHAKRHGSHRYSSSPEHHSRRGRSRNRSQQPRHNPPSPERHSESRLNHGHHGSKYHSSRRHPSSSPQHCSDRDGSRLRHPKVRQYSSSPEGFLGRGRDSSRFHDSRSSHKKRREPSEHSRSPDTCRDRQTKRRRRVDTPYTSSSTKTQEEMQSISWFDDSSESVPQKSLSRQYLDAPNSLDDELQELQRSIESAATELAELKAKKSAAAELARLKAKEELLQQLSSIHFEVALLKAMNELDSGKSQLQKLQLPQRVSSLNPETAGVGQPDDTSKVNDALDSPGLNLHTESFSDQAEICNHCLRPDSACNCRDKARNRRPPPAEKRIPKLRRKSSACDCCHGRKIKCLGGEKGHSACLTCSEKGNTCSFEPHRRT